MLFAARIYVFFYFVLYDWKQELFKLQIFIFKFKPNLHHKSADLTLNIVLFQVMVLILFLKFVSISTIRSCSNCTNKMKIWCKLLSKKYQYQYCLVGVQVLRLSNIKTAIKVSFNSNILHCSNLIWSLTDWLYKNMEKVTFRELWAKNKDT